MSPKLLALLLLAAAPAKAPHPPKAVVDAVRAALNDPASAKFRNVRKTGASSYCGWVNAKNGYGGYAGDQVFYDDDGFVQVMSFEAAVEMTQSPSLAEYGQKVAPCIKDFKGF